jgi:hypothetical protein
MPPSKNTSDWSAHGASNGSVLVRRVHSSKSILICIHTLFHLNYFILHRNIAVQKSSKEFIQARIDSIVPSRLGKIDEQSASEADQLNHVKQRVQQQDTDFSDTKSDPGTKSKQDQEDKMPNSKS